MLRKNEVCKNTVLFNTINTCICNHLFSTEAINKIEEMQGGTNIMLYLALTVIPIAILFRRLWNAFA